CGSYAGFHLVTGAQTGAGGAWVLQVTPFSPGSAGITTTYRSRWKNQVSDTVTVRVHPQLFLQKLNGFFAVTIRGHDVFRGEIATVELRAGSRWISVTR